MSAEHPAAFTCPMCGGTTGFSFDRSLCACGAMHDYCEDCGLPLGCPYSQPEVRQIDSAAQGHSDYRDVPWWGRWIYWRSEWLRGVCRDAWSFRRLRDLEFEREDAEVRALSEEDDHAVA